jgi:hypothetical protein
MHGDIGVGVRGLDVGELDRLAVGVELLAGGERLRRQRLGR